MPEDYTPPAPPEESGFYWAYLLWEFGTEYRTVVFVTRLSGDVPRDPLLLVAASFHTEPWLQVREIIPHDVLRWGPKLAFPPVSEKENP